MSLSKRHTKKGLSRDILKYFLRNPQAADTLEGVANWRLLDEVIYYVVKDTSEALEWLVSQGYLVKDSSIGSNDIFQLNPQKRKDALQFIKQPEPPKSQ